MTDIGWSNFRTAYAAIESGVRRLEKKAKAEKYGKYNRVELSLHCQSDGMRVALMEMEEAFRHFHISSDDGDRCALCNLDLRNDIHIRAGERL